MFTKEKTIESSMRVIRNLPLEAAAHQARSRDRTVLKDSLLNRCLEHIERVRSLIPAELLENNPILEEAWGVYMDLQNFTPLIGESQHWRPGTREFSLDTFDKEALMMNEGKVVEHFSPEIRSGGIGFRHVNWDSNYLMAQPVGGRRDGYWNPNEAKKRRPVRHYTKEEIEKLSGTGW